MKTRLALALAAILAPAVVQAQSTINPALPAQSATLSSAPIRGNFTAAYNDITNVLGMFRGSTAPANPMRGQDWLKDTVTPAVWSKWTGAVWSTIGTWNIATGVFSPGFPVGNFTATAPLVSSSPGIGQINYAISANGISNALIRQGAARSVIGVTGNATANVADIAGTANQVLVVNPAGTALAFGPVNLAASAAVTGQLVGTSFPALSGDITTPGGSLVSTLVNIPNDTPMAGDLLATVVAVPATPAAGKSRIFVDSTNKGLRAINDAGALSVAVFPATAPANQFATAVGTNGSLTFAQPAFSNLSGSATCSQLPALIGDVASTAGSCSTVLATVNANSGAFGSSTAIPTYTVNAKGLITASGTVPVIAPAGTLTGATLASNVLASSLTSVGTLTSGATGAGFTVDLSASTIAGTLPAGRLSGTYAGVTGTGTLTAGTTGAGFTVNLGTSTVSGLLPCANHPALTGNVTSSGCATTIGANQVANSMLAQAGAATLKGNPTGSTATPQDFTIASLTDIGTPSTTLDFLAIHDHVTGAIKKTTPAELVAAVGGGVTSVTIAPGSGVTVSGTCTITTTGTCTVSSLAPPIPPQGRLTLTSGTAVMLSDVAAATVVYYTPAVGRGVPLWNGSSLINTDTGGELSQATTDAAKSPAAVANNSNYDVFAWEDGAAVTVTIASPAVVSYTAHGLLAGMPVRFSTTGALPTGITSGQFYYVISAGLTANAFEFSTTPGGSAVNTSGSQSGTQTLTVERATRGPPWSSDTARGTGAGTTELDFATTPGIPTNKNAITNGPTANRGTYIGTVRSNGSATIDMKFGTAAAGGGMATLGVWNAYNQVMTRAKVAESATSWTYTGASYRPVNASTTNRVNFVIGLQQHAILGINTSLGTSANAANATVSSAMCMDGTACNDVGYQFVSPGASSLQVAMPSNNEYPPMLGFHFLQATERSDGTNTANWNGFGIFQYVTTATPM